jgi:hypothetical protein
MYDSFSPSSHPVVSTRREVNWWNGWGTTTCMCVSVFLKATYHVDRHENMISDF